MDGNPKFKSFSLCDLSYEDSFLTNVDLMFEYQATNNSINIKLSTPMKLDGYLCMLLTNNKVAKQPIKIEVCGYETPNPFDTNLIELN
jgi:hypothetical protein